jgi:hypothetical protein
MDTNELIINSYKYLIKLQWIPSDDRHDGAEQCLCCLEYDTEGHRPSCELNKTIRALAQTPIIQQYFRDRYPDMHHDEEE